MIILIVYAYDYVYDYLADVGERKGLKGVRMGWDEMRGGGEYTDSSYPRENK